ncbi:MAG: methyltransferase domain-containing protein [Myxococcota bacterium]|nr:methyltransferase domain-containing protein [Myxococcota bacterium]
MAADYDRHLGFQSGRLGRTLEGVRKRAVAALALRPGQTVLDVGCGTGASFARLVEAVGPRGRVIGVDHSPGMLEVASRRIADAGWTGVELVGAPVGEAPLPDADAALLFFTHDLLRAPDALDRVTAALRPGGRVAAAGMKRPSSWPARLVIPTRRIMRRYVTTEEGLDRPWDLLAERLRDVRVETLLLGALYVVAGRVGSGQDR